MTWRYERPMDDGDHFAVLLDGACEPSARLRHALAGARSIAADGGMRHAVPLGLWPELWVGDFDSAEPELRDAYPDVPRDHHPVAKDATDGEIAIRTAMTRGARRLTIVGAFGGPRIDHALGTIALTLSLPPELRVAMTDGRQWGYPLHGGKRIEIGGLPHATLSIVGFSDLGGLDITGTQWTLAGASVPFGSSLALSNGIDANGSATIALREGRALVVVTPAAD